MNDADYPIAIITINEKSDISVDISPILLPPDSLPHIVSQVYKKFRDAYIQSGQLNQKDLEKFEMNVIQSISEEIIK
jgi:hypothetical protein